jgi:tRNA pseudouridine32 synthase/23S rRNA pseudouridine746 synthase
MGGRDSGLRMTPEEMEARLLYRDGLMLILDKPAGLPVHRGPRGAASKAAGQTGALQDHFDALRFGLPRAPELAHRLDRETSGCLVLGRHRKALATLGDLFKEGRVGKTYWAVVEGGPEAAQGTIDLPLGRLNETRGWWMKVDPNGAPSLTEWKVMGRNEGKTWLALEPVTGRTHQLRVHCKAMGWPIMGDSIYGTAPRFGGPMLHLLSREIVVPLYRNRDPIRAVAPVPEHMREALAACGWKQEDEPQTSP